jgi:hypothetical protein
MRELNLCDVVMIGGGALAISCLFISRIARAVALALNTHAVAWDSVRRIYWSYWEPVIGRKRRAVGRVRGIEMGD